MTLSAEQEWLLGSVGGGVVEFFAEIGIDLKAPPGALEAPVSCFANPAAHNRDDRKPSCSVNLTSGVWHCKACGEKGNPYRAAQLMGRSDRDAANLARRHGLFLSLEPDQVQKPKLPGERKLKEWRIRLRESPLILARLQELKGWSPWAIARLGLGWDGERVTFPIRDGRHKIVGVVRYLPGGDPKTLALPGSRRDLFPPPEKIRKQHPLFVVEGEADAVAMASLGLRATAVPGSGSWKREWALRLAGRRVVVLADCDVQGRGLAARIQADVPHARVVDLWPAASDGEDIGDWVREMAPHGLPYLKRALEGLVA